MADPWRSTDDPLWQRLPAPYTAEFGCLGLRLHVAAARHDLLELARVAWGRFVVPEIDGAPVEVTLLAEPNTGGVAPRADDDAIGRALFRERGTLYLAQDGRGNTTVANLALSEVVVYLGPAGLGADGPGADGRATLLESPVWRIAAWRGLTTVHAAGVVIDGVSLVLRGPSGAGKSTLAGLAALAGQAVLAEEGVWVDARGPELCLRGAPWGLRLDARGRAALAKAASTLRLPVPGALASSFPVDGEAADGGTRNLDRGASEPPLDVARDLGGRTVERTALGALVLLEPAEGGEAGWSALAATAARAQYEAMTTAGERSQDPTRWAAAREALLAGGAFRLAVGEPAATFQALLALAARLGGSAP